MSEPTHSEDAPKSAGGLAIASLICGILGFCFLPIGIAALIMGIVALVKGKPGQPKGMAIAGTVMGGLSLLTLPILLGIMVPVLSKARQTANVMKDSINIRMIGVAETQYAQAHPDQPVTLGVLLKEGSINPTQLVSSFDDRPEAKTPITAENAAQVSSFILVPGFENKQRHDVVTVFVDPTLEVYALKKKVPVTREDSTSEESSVVELK